MRGYPAVSLLVLAFLLCGCSYRENAPGAAGAQTEPQSTEQSESAQTDLPEELSGEWYLLDFSGENEPQRWEFRSDGVLAAGEEEREWELKKRVFGNDILLIDGKRYEFTTSDQAQALCICDVGGGVAYALFSPDSSRYREYLLQQEENSLKKRIAEECADLFEAYPDKDDWLGHVGSTNIPLLADEDYITRSVEDGEFHVATASDLASAAWYLNTQDCRHTVIYIDADIDLSGVDWKPIGWYSGDGRDHPFTGGIAGNGHTISNMTVDTDLYGGFLGWETACTVIDLNFDNAEVNGNYCGVLAGQAIMGTYYNINITNSRVNGSNCGSMLGWDANTVKENCTADVLVNGEAFEFLSYNEYEKSKIVIDDPVEITIDENHTVTRPEVEGYTNLGWMVFYNGEQVLHRNAENELSYTYFMNEPGTYEIYLTAFVSGQYVPISNTVSYTLE